MKKISFIVILVFLFTQMFSLSVQAKTMNYGVFIGLDSSNINKLIGFDEVVIDATYYTKSEINYLHKNGIKVYSYINIGSIENFRPYYNEFDDITLGNYENWDDEKWMDVSSSEWRCYVVNVLAKNLIGKGVDGFFLDNLDVYTEYKNDAIFNGILDILNRLNSSYKKPIISNGGYDFFIKAINTNLDICKLVYGVNTESVYTTVDFSTNTFKQRPVKDRNYALEYLNSLKAKGLNIFVIEYTKNATLKKTITDRYEKLGFSYYISSSLNLN